MPRPRKHPHASTSNPAAPAANSGTGNGGDSSDRARAYSVGIGRDCSTLAALQALCVRNDGWLRIVPHDDGSVVFAKWKFTSSRWPNHYVMWRCDDEDYSAMLHGLLAKIEAVDRGDEKPVYDTYYGA